MKCHVLKIKYSLINPLLLQKDDDQGITNWEGQMLVPGTLTGATIFIFNVLNFVVSEIRLNYNRVQSYILCRFSTLEC